MPWLMNKTRPADTDADAFEAADTPTPPHPDPRPEPEPPRPEPAYEDPRNEEAQEVEEAQEAPAKVARPEWFTPTRVMALAAAIPSLAALPWAAWAIAHLIPAPIIIGLLLGIVFDLALVGTVALALTTPRISTQASQVGWVAAIAAAAAIALHTGLGGAALFAITPLLSKALWQLVIASHRADEEARATTTRARRAAEEEEAKAEAERRRREREAAEEEAKADDDSFTVEQRRRLAELRNTRAFTEAEAEELRKLEETQARVDHEAKLAQIRRQAEENMARMDATANLMVRRAELEERIELASPPRRQTFALGSGSFAPDDASALGGDAGMGFASAMAQARMQAPTVRTGPDQEVPGVPGKVPTPTVQTREHPSVVEARRNRAACGQAFQELLEELGEVPSIAAVATAAGVSDRAAGRHLRALGLIPPASKPTN